MINSPYFKKADWTAPANISALTTTRMPGFSQAPYNCNNLALHVNDRPEHVQQNRQQIQTLLDLPAEPVWLEQTHSTVCVIAEEDSNRNADAAISRSSKFPLAIMTADCLPITLCSLNGDEIAAIHAGWRGLYHGIIENTIAKMHNKSDNIIAWIGPAICQKCYETGEEVYTAFTEKHPESSQSFQPTKTKWLANLPQIAEIILKNLGVKAVYQSNLCTFEAESDFFSYRRSQQTGRIATLIWINNQPQDK